MLGTGAMIWKAFGPSANGAGFGLSLVALPLAAWFIAAWLALPSPLCAEPVGVPVSAAQAGPEFAQRPVATAARLEENGDKVKLVFELSARVDAAAFVLAGPARVIVDLPQVAFALDPEAGKPVSRPHRRRRGPPPGLIAAFRFGQLGPGKSRIVIDLAAPARILRATCEESGGEGKPRLVVELAKTDGASFRAAVQSARAQLAGQAQSRLAQLGTSQSSTTQTLAPAPAKPIVVIDPGHGGIDSGAIVHGLVEKNLVFDFAKAVAAKLEADGRLTVVMTRSDDSFVPLSERVRMAREGDAALFVSIHADTLSDAADVAGATIYTVSDRASDAEAARVAEKENQSDAAAGLDGAEEAGGVSDILFDLTRRETRAYSHVFARTLVNYWKVAARLNKNPQRSAGFRVLKAPDVPSVLLELGYLSNQKDDLALTSPEWREQASSRVAEAIEAFFSARGAVGPIPSGAKDGDPAENGAPERVSGSAVQEDGSNGATASVRAPATDIAHRGH